jgi:hypothetical protein
MEMALQAGRHALDGRRRRRHHRAAVLHAERFEDFWERQSAARAVAA